MNIHPLLHKPILAVATCDACDSTPCTCSSSVCGLAFSKAFVEDDE